ncbi:uncharacterized protein LOC105184272 [Harpegnathos saltator]|uniref:Myb/SANT-like DNA-binding domain-containing protein n=1 Tax=Harpegnathos saltator TaxID=610380 RepID=E2BLT6_HARSA|nr:uncharacterized protein LOC105184272 [Harpegnathos saltator]EFN83420.1 hypothetical protein EAI_02239 [Harpegnathos saltator]
MKGYVKRDEEGKILIDSNGFITITCEDESIAFQLHLSEIDEKAEQMCFNVNGKDIYIDIYPGWETSEIDPIVETENDNDNENENDNYKANTPSTSKSGNAVFPWCDASTKIFLREYKLKKELVKNRKLKNMKLAYQEISKNLQENGFNVTPLQVENRFKTLKRAYKNMIISNRRTGRGRYICSYEQDLDEIFSARHLVPEMHGSDVEANGEDNAEGTDKLGITESVRLEAQFKRMIDNLQNCQRALKTLTSKMENRTKNSNDMQHKLLNVFIEMRDMHKEVYARVEEDRLQANQQREETNRLLGQIIKLLQIKKEA